VIRCLLFLFGIDFDRFLGRLLLISRSQLGQLGLDPCQIVERERGNVEEGVMKEYRDLQSELSNADKVLIEMVDTDAEKKLGTKISKGIQLIFEEINNSLIPTITKIGELKTATLTEEEANAAWSAVEKEIHRADEVVDTTSIEMQEDLDKYTASVSEEMSEANEALGLKGRQRNRTR
jgi:hypothetical protein